MILVDTGPLIAIADTDDQDHERSLEALGNAVGPLLIPSTVVVEVCYLLERQLGSPAEAAFLRSFSEGSFTLAHPTLSYIDRMASLIETYADLPLGSVDASLIAMAERLGVTEIATLDRRHFTVVRPRHTDAFAIIPG